jgi:hypothetical protein
MVLVVNVGDPRCLMMEVTPLPEVVGLLWHPRGEMRPEEGGLEMSTLLVGLIVLVGGSEPSTTELLPLKNRFRGIIGILRSKSGAAKQSHCSSLLRISLGKRP